MIEENNSTTIAPENMKIIFCKTHCNLLLEPGDVCTIIKFSLAKHIMHSCIQAKLSEEKPLELKSFSINSVKILGTLKTAIKFKEWQFPKTELTAFTEQFRHIL